MNGNLKILEISTKNKICLATKLKCLYGKKKNNSSYKYVLYNCDNQEIPYDVFGGMPVPLEALYNMSSSTGVPLHLTLLGELSIRIFLIYLYEGFKSY